MANRSQGLEMKWTEIHIFDVQFQHLAILLLDSNLIYSIFSLLFSDLGFPGDSFIGFPNIQMWICRGRAGTGPPDSSLGRPNCSNHYWVNSWKILNYIWRKICDKTFFMNIVFMENRHGLASLLRPSHWNTKLSFLKLCHSIFQGQNALYSPCWSSVGVIINCAP